jgi:hypothetical protein
MPRHGPTFHIVRHVASKLGTTVRELSAEKYEW